MLLPTLSWKILVHQKGELDMAKRLITQYKPTYFNASDQSQVNLIIDLLKKCNDYLTTIYIKDTNDTDPGVIIQDKLENDGTDKFWLKFLMNQDFSLTWSISNDYNAESVEEASWYPIGRMQQHGDYSSSRGYGLARYEAVITEKEDIIIYCRYIDELISYGSVTRQNEADQPVFAITRFSKIVDNELQSAIGIIYFNGQGPSGVDPTTYSNGNNVLYCNSISPGHHSSYTCAYPPYGGSGLIFPDSDLTSLKNNYFHRKTELGAYWAAGGVYGSAVNWNVKRPIYTNAQTEEPCLTVLGLLYTHDRPYVATTTRMIELSRTKFINGLYLFSGRKYYVTYGLAFLDE